MVREGSPSSPRLTLMRPARPVCCEPLAVSAPLYGAPLSVNSGSCGLPLVSDDIVVVTDAAVTSDRLAAPSSRTRSVEPARIGKLQIGGRTQRGVELADDRSHAAGKIDAEHFVVRIERGGVTQRQHRRIVDAHDRKIVRDAGRVVLVADLGWCCRLQSRQIEIIAGAGSVDAGVAVPAVVLSDSALDIDAANWSICACAFTRVLSRSSR